jgi:hypothetical protein
VSQATGANDPLTAMPPPDTVPVEYRVISVEAVRGAGRLVGVARVEIDVAGVVIVLQGVQVRRRPDGRLECAPPVWRNPRTGQSLPAVILPPELAEALAIEVLAVVKREP